MPPIPENALSGKACVIWAIFASDSGRIAGPPSPPLDTNPSTFTSNSSVSGSMGGSEGNVLEETIASAPALNEAGASATMSVVDGVSLHHTGTFATSFTTFATTEMSPASLPTLEPMSWRSMCGHDRFSSKASAPASWHPCASSCQWRNSLSLPEPAMIDATRMRSGYAFLIRSIRGSHQSTALSEMSSQFHDECSAEPGRFCIDMRDVAGSVRMNFVLGPATFVTGCRPIVLVTTPPQPASKARRMLLSDSVGGADDSRNGLANRSPVKVTDRSAGMESPLARSPGKGAVYSSGSYGARFSAGPASAAAAGSG